MAQVFPTKANLMTTKKSLELAKLGYDLMDRKRNILVREMMSLIDEAKRVQNEIGDVYAEAYNALKTALLNLGDCSRFAGAIPIDDTVSVDYRSVMGVEVPIVTIGDLGTNVRNSTKYRSAGGPPMSEIDDIDLVTEGIVTIGEVETNVRNFGFLATNSDFDEACLRFSEVKKLTVQLAQIESSIYRLADAVKKTQKRSNALNHIMIPRLTSTVKFITEALDEKEREDFSRLKVTKRTKERRQRSQEDL